MKYTIKIISETTESFAVEAESPQAALRIAKKAVKGPDGKVWVMTSQSVIAALAAFKSDGQWRNF
jgi:hypothetical protein